MLDDDDDYWWVSHNHNNPIVYNIQGVLPKEGEGEGEGEGEHNIGLVPFQPSQS